jgi:hypothetical protein
MAHKCSLCIYLYMAHKCSLCIYLYMAHELDHRVGLGPVLPPLALHARVAQVVHFSLGVRLHRGQVVFPENKKAK